MLNLSGILNPDIYYLFFMKKIFALFSIGILSLVVLSGTFAQESGSGSNIIADVNLVNQGLVKQEGRLFTLGVNIQNKIGTQSGVMYGVQVYQTVDGKRVLVDEFAVLDPLTIKQNEYAYKEFTYPLPTSISGTIELFAFLKTNKGILLSAAPIKTIDVEAVPVPVDVSTCTLDVNTKTLGCTLTNTTSEAQNVVLVTQVKQGDSVFAPVVQALDPQVVVFKSKEKKEVAQTVSEKVFSKDAFFETIVIDQKTSLLIERTTTSYVSPAQVRSIDNVLIDQTSPKDYDIRVVSLSGRTPVQARVAISDAKGVCASQDITVSKAVTLTSFVLEKACDTTLVSVSMIGDDGAVTDVFETPHKTLFPQESNTKTVVAIAGLVALVSLYVVVRNKRNQVTLKA